MDERWQQLQQLALRQHGFVSTSQVEATGLTRPALNYQYKAGRLERPMHGIYRFSNYPHGENDQEAILMLWAGLNPAIALSHATALSYFELGDAFPERIHLTVPTGFRQRPPPGVVLHKANIAASELQIDGIIRITKPTRSIFDLILSGYPLEQLQLAYEQGLERGLIRHGGLSTDSPSVEAYMAGIPRASQEAFVRRLRIVIGAE